MQAPLIVGIDPGTTTGLALFGLDGGLVAVESRRFFSKAAIRRFILEHGNPVVIASDIRPLPRGLEKIVSSFSAGVVVPDRPWEWKNKKRITESLLKWLEPGERPWRNRHEKDALIAGFYAWKKLRPRLLKMERKGGVDTEALRRSLGGRERIS